MTNETTAPRVAMLGFRQFQTAYVTNDIGRAKRVFADRYGVDGWRTFESALPEGGRLHVELAWSGKTLYELVQAQGPGSAFFTERLPSSFAIRHHHLGFLAPDDEAWEALMAQIEAEAWEVKLRVHIPGVLSACYIEAPELGHYLEFVHSEPGGADLFGSGARPN